MLKGSLSNYWTTKPSASFSWLANKLPKPKDTVFPLIKVRIQNGLSTRFWFDNWTPLGSLYNYLNGSNSCLGISLKAMVGSLVNNGRWRLPPARSEEQLQLQTFLTTIDLTEEEDNYEWELGGAQTSRDSTGEVYTYLRPTLPKVSWEAVVWTKRGVPRHNFHLWLVVQDRIPTRDRLLRWRLQVDPLCNGANESRDHLYQDCPFSFDLWTQLATRLRLQPLRSCGGTLNQMIALPKDKPLTRMKSSGSNLVSPPGSIHSYTWA